MDLIEKQDCALSISNLLNHHLKWISTVQFVWVKVKLMELNAEPANKDGWN